MHESDGGQVGQRTTHRDPGKPGHPGQGPFARQHVRTRALAADHGPQGLLELLVPWGFLVAQGKLPAQDPAPLLLVHRVPLRRRPAGAFEVICMAV